MNKACLLIVVSVATVRINSFVVSLKEEDILQILILHNGLLFCIEHLEKAIFNYNQIINYITDSSKEKTALAKRLWRWCPAGLTCVSLEQRFPRPPYL